MKKRYACGLITGASAGLGEEFARQLAGRSEQLVLVARRKERLDVLKSELEKDFPNTKIMVVVADLSIAEQRLSMAQQLEDAGLVPDLLVNNAGLGDYGEFVTAEWEALERMLKVNIDALTHLSHIYGSKMAKRGKGWILNVSSLASTLPIPDVGVYAATKAYVSSLSEALRIELRESGVEVMSLCPGPVKTEFGEVARRQGDLTGSPPAHGLFYVPKEQVVAEGLAGLDRGRARVFPGLKVAVIGCVIGVLPLGIIRLLMRGRPRR